MEDVFRILNGGLLLGVFTFPVYLSFRILGYVDFSLEASYMAGGILSALALLSGFGIPLALFCGLLAGMAVGGMNALFYLLSSRNLVLGGVLILSLTSVCCMVFAGGGVSTLGMDTFVSNSGHAGLWLGEVVGLPLWLRDYCRVVAESAAVTAAFVLVGIGFVLMMRSNCGLAIKAVSGNRDFACSMGLYPDRIILRAMVFANAMAGFCGALGTQYHGVAGVEPNLGMLLTGIAAIMLGELFFEERGGVSGYVVWVVLGGSLLLSVLMELWALTSFPLLLRVSIPVLVITLCGVRKILRRRMAICS